MVLSSTPVVDKYGTALREMRLAIQAYIASAVARGGAGGARAPPVFFLKSKNRPV